MLPKQLLTVQTNEVNPFKGNDVWNFQLVPRPEFFVHTQLLCFKQNKNQKCFVKDQMFRTFYLKSQRPLKINNNSFKDYIALLCTVYCLSKMHLKYRLIGSKTHTIYLSMEYTKLTTLSHTLNQNFKDHFLDAFFCQMIRYTKWQRCIFRVTAKTSITKIAKVYPHTWPFPC